MAEAVTAVAAGPDSIKAVPAGLGPVMANVAGSKPTPEALLLPVCIVAIVAVVLAGTTAVVVLRVGAVVPDVLGMAGVVLVLGVLVTFSTCEPVTAIGGVVVLRVGTALVFSVSGTPVLSPVLFPVLPPVPPVLPPGMGTLGVPSGAETEGL